MARLALAVRHTAFVIMGGGVLHFDGFAPTILGPDPPDPKDAAPWASLEGLDEATQRRPAALVVSNQEMHDIPRFLGTAPPEMNSMVFQLVLRNCSMFQAAKHNHQWLGRAGILLLDESVFQDCIQFSNCPAPNILGRVEAYDECGLVGDSCLHFIVPIR